MRRSSSLHSVDDVVQRNISNDKYEDIVTVGQNINNVVPVGQNIDAVITVSQNISDLREVIVQIVPNIAEILLADDNAALVTSLYDAFDDRYLGSRAVEPVVDNDGDPLLDGALYWNTEVGTQGLYVWNGTAWISVATTNGTETFTNKVLDDISNYIGANHIHFPVRNESGALIPAGTVVTYSGTQPGTDYLQVVPITDSTTQIAVGITHNALANNGVGLCTNTGVVTDYSDTSMWEEGTILYPNSTGGLTDTKPTGGLYQACAVVTRSHGTQGTLLVEFSEPTYVASTTQAGVVQLVNDLMSADSTKALTAAQGKRLKDLLDTNTADITALENNKLASVVPGTNITVDNTDPLNPIISAIPSTTAGILTRLYATGDTVTLSSGTYYLALAGDEGTVASASQTVNVDDNTKAFFAQDFITETVLENTTYYAGSYSGYVDVMTNEDLDQERFTVEVYLADTDGTVIDSGITGQPVGALGVKVLTLLDTGVINLTANEANPILLRGELVQNYLVTTGQRIRFHVSGEKIGTIGGIATLTFYFGRDRNSFIDVPVAVTTDAVVNNSAVVGATATDALDKLNSDKFDKAGGTVTGDTTFQGNVFVNGATIQVDSQVTTTDNTVVLNSGEAGAGVTLGTSGLEIERGTLTNYAIQFDEADDAFKIGKIGALQKVATREDAPIDGGIAVWDSATFKFITTNLFNTRIDNLEAIDNAVTQSRYDKRLASLDIIATVFNVTTGSLETIRYSGDDDATIYYRDIMSYDIDGNLIEVKHFYGTLSTAIPSATTTITYVDGSFSTVIYTEA